MNTARSHDRLIFILLSPATLQTFHRTFQCKRISLFLKNKVNTYIYIYIRGIASLQTSWITAEYYFRLMSLLIRKINSLYRGNNQIYRRVKRRGGERSIGKKKNSLDFPSFLPFPLPSPPPPISKITE